MGLKILGKIGTHVILYVFLVKNDCMYFERHFAFQNA